MLLGLLCAAPTAAQEVVGTVKSIAGPALVVRGGQSLQATLGMPVYASDTLRTGRNGGLGVTLRDDTRLALGADTELSVAHYAYAPAEASLGLTLRLIRGALSYLSGRIAKLAPGAVRVETPRSVIGVRGTHLLIRVEP